MGRTAVIHTRVEPEIKQQAEDVLKHLGISTSDAVNMLLRQVVLRKGMPFDVIIPEYAEEEVAV